MRMRADPDPDPSFQMKGQNFEKVLKYTQGHIPYILSCLKIDADPDPDPAYSFDEDADPDPDSTF
jgi:hypothetical protein